MMKHPGANQRIEMSQSTFDYLSCDSAENAVRSRGAINVVTGEYMAPAGPNVVSTRNGTLYVGAGPNGYVNSRNGQFIPAH